MSEKAQRKNRISKQAASMDSTLAYLRDVIPDFDERCKNFYLAWRYMMNQRIVTRMGYVKMHFYKKLFKPFLPASMPMTDADHVFGLVNAVILFKDFFGDFIPYLYGYAPQWLDHIEEVVFHEIGEIEIGDWTDDGACDTNKKDELEQEAFNKFMEIFPAEARNRHLRQFADLRDRKTMTKLFDKEAFILGFAYFKSKGIVGSMLRKRGITKRDRDYCRKTGSKRAFDNAYAHMLDAYKGEPFLPFFVGINEAIYAVEYNEFDPLVKDCTPGVPPPGVKKFY